MWKSISRRVATAGVIGAVGAGAALIFGGTAEAAPPGYLAICTAPNYALSVKFPGRGGLSAGLGKYSKVTCVAFKTDGSVNERIDVYSGNRFLGSTIYNGTRGIEVHGTAGPSFYVI